ncbi:MAG: hypothetical protein ACP5XB_08285 [Isosphaeraceae bacterium]
MSQSFDEHTPETRSVASRDDLPPADEYDPVIEAYKKDVDRTLLRENLKLTVEERFVKFERVWEYAQGLREAGWKHRQTGSGHGAELPRDPANTGSE